MQNFARGHRGNHSSYILLLAYLLFPIPKLATDEDLDIDEDEDVDWRTVVWAPVQKCI